MMLLPIGHEEDSVRRLPWVSIAIVAVCVLFHLAGAMGRDRLEQRAVETLTAAVEYYYTHPHLEPHPRLRPFVSDAEQLVGEEPGIEEDAPLPEDFEPDDAYAYPDAYEEPLTAAEREAQQQELDGLVAAYAASLEALPELRWGLVPAAPKTLSYLTSMFVHGGWMHLLGNLFFLWLAGPALEDRWGRPLFAVFYLLCGVVGGLLWVGRYSDSLVPLVGASGAIAGLMGAFAVRFWSTRIRFLYLFFWLLPPRVFSGTFQAPAWIMLGLWFGRELSSAGATDEMMAAIGGGTAYWVHVWGFAFGVLFAGALRYLKTEEKVLAPKIDSKLGTAVALVNQPLEDAHRLRQEGQLEQAWQTLRKALAQKPGDSDAALALWDLGRELGRPKEAARPLLQAIRHELRRGENELALVHWEEVAGHLGELELDLDLRLRLAEACLKERKEEDAAELLAEVDRTLDPQLPVGLLARLARTATAARSASAPALVAAALARPELPEQVRAELAELAGQLRAFGVRERRAAAAPAVPAAGAIPISGEGPLPLSGAAPIPLAGEERPSYTLQVMAAVPQGLQDGKIALDVEGQGRRQLSLGKVVAVAAARIIPFGAPSWVVIDLLIDPLAAGRAVVRTVRLRSLDFDPAALAATPIGDPLETFLDQLLTASRATPIPDGESVRGRPFQTFPTVEEYQRRVLGA